MNRATLTQKDLLAVDKVRNIDIAKPDQPLGRDQNTIVTNNFGVWPNVTFRLDNSAGLTAKKYLLVDATSVPADKLTAPMLAGTGSIYLPGGIGQFLGTLNTDYFRPDLITPNLTVHMLDMYCNRVNLAIEALMLQTSSDPNQFTEAFELVYGIPGNFNRKDISQSIEFLQSPQNFSELMLKGRVTPMIPVDVLNSPLITVMAGETYTVTASFKAINGLPVAGQVAVPFSI